MGWDVVGPAAPKGPVREKGEKISCPTHGKGSALVPPHHPHPVGIWVPCGTASTPPKPALGWGSPWFKAHFPGGSDTWGQATSTRSHLRGGGQGGGLQNSSAGVPEPRGGCGSGSLPPGAPVPGISSAGAIRDVWPHLGVLVGLHPHLLPCIPQVFHLVPSPLQDEGNQRTKRSGRTSLFPLFFSLGHGWKRLLWRPCPDPGWPRPC